MVLNEIELSDGRRFVIEDNVIKSTVELAKQPTDIGGLVLQKLNNDPDIIGIIEAKSGNQVTFREMRERSVRCALWLRKQDVGFDDIVVALPNIQVDDYVPLLGSFYLGAIYNPWPAVVTHETAREFLKFIKPKVIITGQNSASAILQAVEDEKVQTKIVVWGNYPGLESFDELLDEANPEDVVNFRNAIVENPREKTAVILFSSGTTGKQKGTQHSYEMMSNTVDCNLKLLKGRRITLSYSPPSWVTGMNIAIQSICNGATRVIHESTDPEETGKVIEKYKVTWFFATPSRLIQLWKARVVKRYNFSSLKYIIFGGSKLIRKVMQDLRTVLPRTKIFQAYGMTELGTMGTMQCDECTIPDSVGFVWKSIHLKVVDPLSQRLLGPNEQGEICFKKSHMLIGYYKNAEETRHIMDKDGWLHTGDAGYFTEKGEIFITERLKEIIITQNHHVLPSKVEEILLSHPDVIDAAVTGIPHETDIERPIAFVKKVPGSMVTEEELMNLPTCIDEFMKITGGVKFVEDLPYSLTGKINRKILRDMGREYIH